MICCDALSYVLKKDLLRDVDGQCWLGKFSSEQEENLPHGSILLRYCPMCGMQILPIVNEEAEDGE